MLPRRSFIKEDLLQGIRIGLVAVRADGILYEVKRLGRVLILWETGDEFSQSPHITNRHVCHHTILRALLTDSFSFEVCFTGVVWVVRWD